MWRALAWAVAATWLSGAVPAKADILEADFSGTTGYSPGVYSGSGCTEDFGCHLAPGTPFSASFVFDSSLGMLTSPSPGEFQLTGSGATNPLVSVNIIITGLGSFSNSGRDVSTLSWQIATLGNVTNIHADAEDNGGFNNIDFFPAGVLADGHFQTGTCPGEPCALLNVGSATLTGLDETPSPVPGPLAGSGLVGACFLIALFGGMYRVRRSTLIA